MDLFWQLPLTVVVVVPALLALVALADAVSPRRRP